MTLSKFNFEQVGPSLTDSDISEFEREIGGVLDDDFKLQLREINGGLARPILRSNLPELQFEISMFLGLEPGYTQLRRAFFDLEESLDELAPELNKLVPFALDFGDGAICVVLGKASSEVVYVPTINSLSDEDIALEVIVVAKSFNDFVDTLSEHE
ncbi:MAG: SMI1/KNR4 family protein [Pirellulales bacterium]|nr:SMI1/KNR4 family protein [Pirellulales bacterium]